MLKIFNALKSTALLLLPNLSFAFPCYLTVAKDNCWKDFDVTITVSDARTLKKIKTILIPKGALWERQLISCETGQNLVYNASYSPKIWDTEKAGQLYSAKRVWTLPASIKAGVSAWEVSICFAKQFSEVPTSLNQVNSCTCDFSTIPPIPKPIIYRHETEGPR